jgi:hypothetical protein
MKLWPNLRYLAGIVKENRENLSQVSRFPDRNLKRTSCMYKSEGLQLEPACSVCTL